jgi:hypothetical protein
LKWWVPSCVTRGQYNDGDFQRNKFEFFLTINFGFLTPTYLVVIVHYSVQSRSQSYDFLFCSYIQRQRFYIRAKFFFILKTRHAIGCAVYFYKAGVATRGRRIGS